MCHESAELVLSGCNLRILERRPGLLRGRAQPAHWPGTCSFQACLIRAINALMRLEIQSEVSSYFCT